jgi:hypothetical protein
VALPESMHEHLRTRGGIVPDDLHPEFPGVPPTVHRAGEGARTVLVQNFHYSSVRYHREREADAGRLGSLIFGCPTVSPCPARRFQLP